MKHNSAQKGSTQKTRQMGWGRRARGNERVKGLKAGSQFCENEIRIINLPPAEFTQRLLKIKKQDREAK